MPQRKLYDATLNVNIPQEYMDRLNQLAEEHHCTKSDIARHILGEALGGKKNKDQLNLLDLNGT